jgi:methyl-accepting chemotaxis protein
MVSRRDQIKAIVKRQNEALAALQSDMARLGRRLRVLAEKAESGTALTQPERKEQLGLLDELDKIVASERRLILLGVRELDSSAAAKSMADEVDQINKELDDVLKRVEKISKTIKQASDFLKTVTGVLVGLAGLLKGFA